MKMTFVILLVACLQVSARSYSQKVSFQGRQVKLESVFSEIRRQTGYVFFYSYNLLEQANPVTISVKDVTLEEMLRQCFRDQPFDYSIENKTIVVKKKKDDQAAERISWLVNPPPAGDVKGRVVNEKGEPLSGAYIRTRPAGYTTVTNEKGEFSITNLDRNATILEISFIGYVNQTVRVKDEAEITVTLAADVNDLDAAGVQVVSTGYQSVSRERAAGSFAKPDKAIFQARSTSMNVIQRLEGLVPGLTINNAPAESQRNGVLIRGITSVNGSRAPLFVVDGLPLDDISAINPNDIQDITVLKDATAASIWGSRASNGVIVIVTKKGNSSVRLQLGYDGFVSFQGKPQTDYFPVLNSRQFIQTARDLFDPVNIKWPTIAVPNTYGVPGIPPHDQILYDLYNGKLSSVSANASLDSLAAIDNSRQIKDLWYRNAMMTNHTLSLQGGNGRYSIYGSLAYTNTKDNTPANSSQLFKVNIRQDVQVNKVVSIYLITDITNTLSNTSPAAGIRPDARFLPYALFRDGNGKNLSMPWLYLGDSVRNVYEKRSLVSLDYNALDELSYGYTKSDALLARINAGFTLRLMKGLKFEGTYGIVRGSNKSRQFNSAESYIVRNQVVQLTVPAASASGFPTYYLPKAGGRYNVANIDNRSWTVRNQLTWEKDWNKGRHLLNLLAGQEIQAQRFNTVRSTVWGYDDKLLTYAQLDYKTLASPGIANPVYSNNLGRSILASPPFAETETEVRLRSWYANAAYTFKSRYTLNASTRLDESNLFGKDKSAQNRPVWSIGGKWLITREPFLYGMSWLDMLALRATYGVTGLSPVPGAAATVDILSAAASTVVQSGQIFRISTPGNRKLTWEATRTWNGGVDFAFAGNRISGSVDAYIKKTSNLIGRLTLNSFTGVPYITGNMGDMTNKGIELLLNTVNVSNRDFSWNTRLVMAYNTNKITSLVLPAPLVKGNDLVAVGYAPGYSAAAVFSYPFAGLDNVGDPQVMLRNKTLAKAPNITAPEDIIYSGTYQPRISGGFSNIFRYRNLELSGNLVFNLAYVMRRDVNTFYEGSRLVPEFGSFTTGNVHAEFSSRWQKSGDEASTLVPAFVGNDFARSSARDKNYYTQGDVNVVSADYVKLRDITLSYSLPQQAVRHAGISGLTFRFQVNNVMVWKANNYNIDPEFHNAVTGMRTMPFNQNAVTLGVHATF